MKITPKLYYVAAILALAAAAVNVYVDRVGQQNYFYIGFLILMSVIMFWLGSRGTNAPPE
jgi:surface polysaccharide O-acyltransferase-like enzyme